MMNNKRVYVATYFDWFSFGAVMQAMSFNHFLIENGYNAKLIDYQHQDLRINHSKSIKSIIKSIILYPSRRTAKTKAELFLKENISFTLPFKRFSDLKALDDESAVFIAGSDQIWNPSICSDFFFLRFVKNGKRISYAASMGDTNIPSVNRTKFFDYLRDFETVSVREDDVCTLLCENRINSFLHVDPVFLYDKSFWSIYEKPVDIDSRYILLFPIYWDEKLNDEIKRIKKETGLPVYSISSSRKVYSDKVLFGITADQLLFLINHAEKIITSSFHGTAFSIILKKEFCSVIDPSKTSRIACLLKKFELQEAIYKDRIDFIDSSRYSDRIDYIIETERKKSLTYLRESIGID